MKKTFIASILILLILIPLFSSGGKDRSQKKYLLVFDVIDYNTDLKKAINYFFKSVLSKGDHLYLLTPKQLYNLSKYAEAGVKKDLVKKTLNVLKKDIETGATLWKNIDNKRTLRDIKNTYEEKILNCTKILGQSERENHLVMIYQIRYSTNLSESKSLNYNSMNLKVGEQYEMTFDSHKVIQALQSVDSKFHFLYLDIKPSRRRTGDTRRALGSATLNNQNSTELTRMMANTSSSSGKQIDDTTVDQSISTTGLGKVKTNDSADVHKIYKNLSKELKGLYQTSKKPISFFKAFAKTL